MQVLSVEKGYSWSCRMSEQMRKVMRMFGLTVEAIEQRQRSYRLDLSLKPGQICFLAGPSGSGKSTLLRELYRAARDPKIWLEDIELDGSKSLIDCMEGSTTLGRLTTLSRAGLSDVFTVLNPPANLSEGQKYRYRLARAMACDAEMIFADEFCSNLDRIGAAVIAHNIARFTARTKKTFVLAGARDDFLADLRPDVIVKVELDGKTEIITREERQLL